MADPRSVAVQGIGYGTNAVAAQGFGAVLLGALGSAIAYMRRRLRR